MSEEAPAVWVVIPHYGCEGYGEPALAFRTFTEAEAYVASMRNTYASLMVIKVPMVAFGPAGVPRG